VWCVVGRDDYPTPLSEMREERSEALWKGRTGGERRFAPGLLLVCPLVLCEVCVGTSGKVVACCMRLLWM